MVVMNMLGGTALALIYMILDMRGVIICVIMSDGVEG